MTEQYRPTFHFTPPAHWMNDPNGLVYHEGVYHLFYQHHPNSVVWGPMHWGHAVSRDLIHWQHLPIALYPDQQGMIYSGSAVVDHGNTAGFGANTLVTIFTHHNDHHETQNLAFSLDNGKTWTKYVGNPVLRADDGRFDFRDPKVFWYDDHWVMCLAAGQEILFYVSPDLKHWERSGSFGDEFGSHDGVWETPDLFELRVEKSNEIRWVLLNGVSSGSPAGGSGTQYFIGHFDGRTFTSENSPEKTMWMDHGADFYAVQSWNNEPNGRRLALAWMSNWQYARFVPASTWRGGMSLIREISLQRVGDEIHLIQEPLPELQRLRGGHFHWQNEVVEPHTNLLAGLHGNSLEIIAEFKLIDGMDCFGFHIRAGEDERTTIFYKAQGKQLFVDRTRSGRTDFHEAFARIHSASLLPNDDVIRLQIFVDASSLEVFANDGMLTFSECLFPAEQSQGLELFVEGGNIFLISLDVFLLKPAQFQITGD